FLFSRALSASNQLLNMAGMSSVLQIIVFMCYGIMLNKWVLQTYQPDFMKSPLVYHPGHRAQVWRFFSYMFMHVGYVDMLLFPHLYYL
ncbi:hypothetical protein XENOCAPTIV_024985, partial [Xenoophorus captivus]